MAISLIPAASAVSGTLPAANLPTGSVLQVVQGSYSTQVNSSTTTLVDTGLTATITPKFATSKILVIVNHPECYKSNGNSSNGIAMSLFRNSTNIAVIAGSVGYTNTTLANYFATNSCILDSPATTSATTYKTQFSNTANAASAAVNTDNAVSTITLMEIAA